MKRFAELESKRSELRQQLVLGSARRELDIPSDLRVDDSTSASTLNLLSALSLRNRLSSPAKVEQLVTCDSNQRPERLPELAVRQLLCRLFVRQVRYTTDAVPLRALDALHRAKLDVHPYDFVLLENLMIKDRARASKAARAWLAVDTETREVDVDDISEEANDESWQDLPPSLAIEFLQERRRTHPDVARGLVEAALKDSTATMRVKLLGALSVSLSQSDVELLNQSLEDRAASVRAQAVRLLSNIAGTDQHNDRLGTAMASITVKKSKLLGPRAQIHLAIPASVAKSKRTGWVEDVFSDIDPLTLCETLELKAKEFCSAVGDEDLRRTLSVTALKFGHTDLATGLVSELSVRQRIALAHSETVSSCQNELKPYFWRTLLANLKPAGVEDLHWVLSSLYVGLRCRPPEDVFARHVVGKLWRAYVKNAAKDPENCDPEVAELFLALAPLSARASFDQALVKLPTMLTTRARTLGELFTRLELLEQN